MIVVAYRTCLNFFSDGKFRISSEQEFLGIIFRYVEVRIIRMEINLWKIFSTLAVSDDLPANYRT